MSDPFATFGLTPAFELDLSELERRHRELSRALHPDRYAGRGSSERRQALGKAIEVNETWRRLKNPVKRAEALLERLGLGVAEGQEPKPPPEFLMEVLERREELAEARRAADVRRVEELAGQIRNDRERVLREIGELFARALGGANGDAGGTALLSRVGELRYFERFLEEVSAIQDEIV